MTTTIHVGDCRDALATLPDQSVHCCVTSPPYFGLRDYKIPPSTWGDGWVGCLGNEPTVQMYVGHVVEVFREVRRVLRDDGTLWLNLGDSYANSGQRGDTRSGFNARYFGSGEPGKNEQAATHLPPTVVPTGLKPKDLIGIPWRIAFALQADGWYLRSDIIWSKPNPLPESVRDRPTKSHDYIFLLSKRPRYFFDAGAVKEEVTGNTHSRGTKMAPPKTMLHENGGESHVKNNQSFMEATWGPVQSRNIRSVWTIATHPYAEAHFATFPPKLAERCILAGTSHYGACGKCGAPWRRLIETEYLNPGNRTTNGPRSIDNHHVTAGYTQRLEAVRSTIGWEPSCGCDMTYDTHYKPDDFELIATPLTEDGADDHAITRGRKGYLRVRSEGAGVAISTRYEQRCYAKQIRGSAGNRDRMEAEAGASAFAHYIRLDRAGARPVPPKLLEVWIRRGWLHRVPPPQRRPYPVRPCVVLDPFGGSGTVSLEAERHGRDSIYIDLKPEYVEMARKRITTDAPLLTVITG